MAETTPKVAKTTPKDVYLQLLATVTLYASVVSFIALCWQFINYWYPDPLNYISGSVASVRWAASMLIVMFPVFVYVTRLINRGFAEHPDRKHLWVYKWLTYLTLFISAITIIIDVVTLVYNLMGGEITTRFILKVLVVLVTAAAVFAYYRFDMNKSERGTALQAIGWTMSMLVLAAVVGAFFVIGSPAKQRRISFDNERINHLQSIQSQILYQWQNKGGLPTSLDALADSISGYNVPTDPETKQAYEYRIVSDNSFELCATFNLPSTESDSTDYYKPISAVPGELYNQNWDHGSGRTCFSRTIDPELYKRAPVEH